MKDSTIVILVVGVVAVLFWAASRGLLGVGLGPTGLVTAPGPGQQGAIFTPQPSQNYSGYLAASTAPGVANTLNTAMSGIGNALAAWLSPKGQQNPPSPQVPVAAVQPIAQATTQGIISAIGASPAFGAGPQLNNTGFYSGASANPVAGASAAFGPVVPPELAYDATSGAAFDYTGLSSANSFDPGYSLSDPAFADAGLTV